MNYGGFLLAKAVVFVNTIILARLLAPEDFGLVAIGLLLLSISEAAIQSGISAAIVWRRGDWEQTAAVALTLGIIASVILMAVIYAGAPTIAGMFDAPDAVPVIRVISVCVLLGNCNAVFLSILQRQLRFGRRQLADLSRSVLKGLVGIPLAFMGFGVWSLVYAQIASLLLGTLIAIPISGWRPKLGMSREVAVSILGYGAHVSMIGLLGVATKKLDIVAVGASLTTEALGLYSIAFLVVEMVVLGLCWAASNALFPTLSEAGGDTASASELLKKGLGLLMSIVLPLALGLAVLAKPLFALFFGEKWLDAAAIVEILAFYSIIYAAGYNLGDAYKAMGRPNILTYINLFNLVIAFPVLFIAARWGLIGVAAGQVVIAIVVTTTNWIVARRVLGIGFSSLVSAIALPAVSAFAAYGLCHLLLLSDMAPKGAFWQIVVVGGTGLAAYLALLAGLSSLSHRVRGSAARGPVVKNTTSKPHEVRKS